MAVSKENKRFFLNKNQINYQHMLLLLSVILIFSPSVFAQSTNGTDKILDVSVTSGSNAAHSSSSYSHYISVGTLSGVMNSSSYITSIGFLYIAPYLDGEACQVDSECKGNYCCSNVCQSSACPLESGSSGSSGSGRGGGGGFVIPIKNKTDTAVKGSTHLEFALNKLWVTGFNYELNKPIEKANVKIDLVYRAANPLENALQYFEISSLEISSSMISMLEIYFKVPLIDNPDIEKIKLFRFDAAWYELPTSLIETDDNYAFFRATASHDGLFAISYKRETAAALAGITGDSITEIPEQMENAIPPEQQSSKEIKNLFKPLLPFVAVVKSSALMLFILAFIGVLGFGSYQYAIAMHKGITEHFFKLSSHLEQQLRKKEINVAIETYYSLMKEYEKLMQSKLPVIDKERIDYEFKTMYMKLWESTKQLGTESHLQKIRSARKPHTHQ